MKYCTKCKCITNDDKTEICPECRKKMITSPAPSSPVRIITAEGFEFERICASLDDQNIPYSYSREKNDAVIRVAVPESAALNDIFVPLSYYEDAQELLSDIGAKDEKPPVRLTKAESDRLNKAKNSEEELSPGKARAIRILSGIAFLLILAATVFVSDWIIALIKNLFTQG